MQRGQHLGEAHTSEVHTSGVHTPLKDTTPKHRIATMIQLPTLIYNVGANCSYPHFSTALAGLTHSGERRSTRKECLARITDRRTVHNQWTRTIAIGLNTLQRLYNCTRPNRTETCRHQF
jgi:acyl-CoA reductase-like NAD-dependent aldehyde dehydrogenase